MSKPRKPSIKPASKKPARRAKKPATRLRASKSRRPAKRTAPAHQAIEPPAPVSRLWKPTTPTEVNGYDLDFYLQACARLQALRDAASTAPEGPQPEGEFEILGLVELLYSLRRRLSPLNPQRLQWFNRKGYLIASASLDSLDYEDQNKYGSVFLDDFLWQLTDIEGRFLQVPWNFVYLTFPIRAFGRLIRPTRIKVVPGKPKQCHRNSIALWREHPDRYTLMTGYALYYDTWDYHSWLMTNTGTLVETTFARELYYGIPLEGNAAESFCWLINDDGKPCPVEPLFDLETSLAA